VSLENEDVVEAYRIIRKELRAHDEVLTSKPEIVVLTKTDTVDEAAVAAAQESLRAETDADIHTTSIIDDKAIKRFRDALVVYLRNAA
jgi:GTP-binding protein